MDVLPSLLTLLIKGIMAEENGNDKSLLNVDARRSASLWRYCYDGKSKLYYAERIKLLDICLHYYRHACGHDVCNVACDQISSKGIGNGISMIIFAGIVSSLPNKLFQLTQNWFSDKVDKAVNNYLSVSNLEFMYLVSSPLLVLLPLLKRVNVKFRATRG